MEIDRNAPATAEGELGIDADPQTVFSVIATIDQWPSWNPDVKSVSVEGPVQPGTVFRWKAGPSSLTSTLQMVDPPREIAWTGTTMGIRAVHVFRFQAADGGTLAHSEESWAGLLPSLLKGYSRRTLDKSIRSVLAISRPRPSAAPRPPEHSPRLILPCAPWGELVTLGVH